MGVRLLCPVFYFGYVANGRYFWQIYGVSLYVLYLAVFPYVIYKYINLPVLGRFRALYGVFGRFGYISPYHCVKTRQRRRERVSGVSSVLGVFPVVPVVPVAAYVTQTAFEE